MYLRDHARAAVAAGILALGAGGYGLLMASMTTGCGPQTSYFARSICHTTLNSCTVSSNPLTVKFQCQDGDTITCTNSGCY